jgi:hypothetical protein
LLAQILSYFFPIICLAHLNCCYCQILCQSRFIKFSTTITKKLIFLNFLSFFQCYLSRPFLFTQIFGMIFQKIFLNAILFV